MKRKIISIVCCFVLLIAVFSTSAFAYVDINMSDYSVGSDYFDEPLERDHYGKDNGSAMGIQCQFCMNSGCEYCEAYDFGYIDGLMDGYEKGFYDGEKTYENYYSYEQLQQEINVAIQNYKNSTEFEMAVSNALSEYLKDNDFSADAMQQAIGNFKNSQEYKDLLNSEREAGLEEGRALGYALGEQSGKEIGYAEGYASGKNEFRASDTYRKELENNAIAGYDLGYQEGYGAGSQNNVDFSEITPLIITLFLLFFAVVVLVAILSKVRKKVKR